MDEHIIDNFLLLDEWDEGMLLLKVSLALNPEPADWFWFPFVTWHQMRGLLVDARQRQVDERHVVTSGEHPRDALARREALVDDRPGERALARPPPDDVQLVFGKKVRRGEEVGDQLCDGVDRRGRGKSPAGRAFAAGLTSGAEIWGTFGVHIPRMRYRRKRPKA